MSCKLKAIAHNARARSRARRDWISLVFEWIPQMVFMLCTFFYMISIIVYKWSVDWV